MTYPEILEKAKDVIGPFCKACHVCDGKACRNQMPGPGAKGVGDTAIRNYEKWKEIRIQMDTLCENRAVDLSCRLFGKTFSYPFFAGPVGAVNLHYGDLYNDLTYNDCLIKTCAKEGIAAFSGDGVHADVVRVASKILKNYGGIGVPTIKPWSFPIMKEKIDLVHASGAFAMAMDIDASGLPFLQHSIPPSGTKTVEELEKIISYAHMPFIVKGIMTVQGAQKAMEAGADAIVVSNHGGRVLDGCPATAEVLPQIVDAVGKNMTVLVDGGIRSGVDIFRALALGADGVLICRPFVPMVYGGGEEGVSCYIHKLAEELSDTMAMCGAHSLEEIKRDMIFRG